MLAPVAYGRVAAAKRYIEHPMAAAGVRRLSRTSNSAGENRIIPVWHNQAGGDLDVLGIHASQTDCPEHLPALRFVDCWFAGRQC